MQNKIGEMLVERGILAAEEIEGALAIQHQYGGRLGEILVNQGSCSEDDVLDVLSEQLELPRLKEWVAQSDLPADGEAIEGMGMDAAWWLAQQAIPLGTRDGKVWIAMTDVLDPFVPEAIQCMTHQPVMPVITGSHELRQLLALVEGATASAAPRNDDTLQDLATGAPIIKFVNDTIQRALDAHASDIHFETYRGIFRVRFRVDGVLHEVDRPGLGMQAPVISRLKLMADLDIAEKRLPQDGRIRIRLSGLDLDVRVATSPGVAGESVVLRLLVSEGNVVSLNDLGMHEDHASTVKNLLTATSGIILVTGPTGSGKSTTLYAFLRSIMSDERKIITVEDPVEYQTPGITQIPVNSEIGLTFDSVLRSVLRQDPDVVLIGEIRDRETAQIAVQAALTGHLVLSTLHTNDAPSAFVRMMDMGVEAYLLASSVIGVIAQRLVRRTCPHCAEPSQSEAQSAEALGWEETQRKWPALAKTPHFVHGKGCSFCLGTGYHGRRSIFEMFSVDDTLRHLLATEPEQIHQYLLQQSMRTLRQDGLLFAGAGETTVTEVLRVTG